MHSFCACHISTELKPVHKFTNNATAFCYLLNSRIWLLPLTVEKDSYRYKFEFDLRADYKSYKQVQRRGQRFSIRSWLNSGENLSMNKNKSFVV